MSDMKPRTFLIEVNIALPKGNSSNDWSYVDHQFAEVREDHITGDLNELYKGIMNDLTEWCYANKEVHDCYENSEQLNKSFYCTVCGTETTKEFKRRLAIMEERKVNGRATTIIDL